MIRTSMFIAALAASGAAAQDVDVGARIAESRVVTWAADHAAGVYLYEERVFEGEFNLVGTAVTAEEPGYFLEPGNAFTGSRIGFNIRAAVREWSTSAQNFDTLSPLTITIGDSVLGVVTTPIADPPVPVPGLSIVVPPAGVDFHFPMELNGNSPGIYLLELELFTDIPSTANSLPYWAVLNYGLDPSEHEASIDWVRQNLVPAPGGVWVFAAAAGLARRRRR
jgi:hypothetical protein